MRKMKKKNTDLAVKVDSNSVVLATRSVSALTKPDDLNVLKRNREVYKAATEYAKTLKGGRIKLVEAAALQLRTEIQIGAVLQEMNRGNDVTDTHYEDFLQEQTITPSQANRWRDMGYKMAKANHVKSIIDESLKFSPEFLAEFEKYVKWCADDPLGEAVPSFNGFKIYIHDDSIVRAKKERERLLVAFCRNLPFKKAEILAAEIRSSIHLDMTQERWDELVWGPILDKRNIFYEQAIEMNRRDREKVNAL